MKDCFSRNSVDSECMRARIMEAIQSVTKGMLTCHWIELVYGLDVIKTTRGLPFEVEKAYIKLLSSGKIYKSQYFYLLWLSCNNVFTNTNRTFLDILSQMFRCMAGLSSTYR